MIFQFGTIALLGLCSLYGVNDNPSFDYKARCVNNNVLTSQYLEFHTDDDDYYALIDLKLSFDFYYSSDTALVSIDNLHLSTTLSRYYYNTSTFVASYNIDLDCGDYSLLDFENLTYTAEWRMYYEGDTLHFSLINNGNTYRTGYISPIPSGEEFDSTYGFDYVLDFSSLYNQLVDFCNYSKGYDSGYYNGYNTGYNNGLSDGNTQGYQSGYTDGYTEGATQDETAVAIFSGIISVGLIPINFFLACLNFEVFGINIGAFVSALLTVAIVVIITRMIVSGGNGGDK